MVYSVARLSFILLALFVACTPEVQIATEQQLSSWENWKKNRLNELKSPVGFLNLAGLYWLQDGANTFGSDSSNDIIFPTDLPKKMGVLELRGNEVIGLDFHEEILVDSVGSYSGQVYHTDSSKVPKMEWGTYRWFIIKRADDIGIRLKNLDHPNLAKEIDIKYYGFNSGLVVNAEFVPYPIPKKLKIENVLGHHFEMNISGQLQFKLNGINYTLEPMDEGKKFFIIFSDETSAIETYGSGRYLYAMRPKPGEKVLIDFNRSYNPPCAFTDFATCLIPPPENRLTIKVEAGELDYHM